MTQDYAKPLADVIRLAGQLQTLLASSTPTHDTTLAAYEKAVELRTNATAIKDCIVSRLS
jgi:hypothetical protein